MWWLAFKKIWRGGNGLLKGQDIPSKFLKAAFHKFYLLHSWILCLNWYSCWNTLRNYSEGKSSSVTVGFFGFENISEFILNLAAEVLTTVLSTLSFVSIFDSLVVVHMMSWRKSSTGTFLLASVTVTIGLDTSGGLVTTSVFDTPVRLITLVVVTDSIGKCSCIFNASSFGICTTGLGLFICEKNGWFCEWNRSSDPTEACKLIRRDFSSFSSSVTRVKWASIHFPEKIRNVLRNGWTS